MSCPICGSETFEKSYEDTAGTLISIRCSKCDYFNYMRKSVQQNGTAYMKGMIQNV